VSSELDSLKIPVTAAPSCRVRDQVIQEFLDGAGI